MKPASPRPRPHSQSRPPQRPEPPGLPARRAALEIVRGALNSRGGLEVVLGGKALHGLEGSDRGFARALAMTVLRRMGPIDRRLATRLSKEPPEPVRDLLRLGLAQGFWMDVPDFAAVDTTVALAPKPLRGLVNAVMRRALADGVPACEAADLAPPWLLARWRGAYGPAEADAAARIIAEEPDTDLTPKAADQTDSLVELEARALAGGSWRTARRGDPAAWPGYDQGAWWVQDAAAAIPARLLRLQPGESALDLCAAPGGKTLQLAAAGAKVTALDRSATRLARLNENLARAGLTAETLAADLLQWPDARRFDAVLLDAPCSATGTFRRHPDVLWNVRPGDIGALSAQQGRMLEAAAARVAPGGRLVYCVCSLEPEEGEARIAPFLAAHPEFSPDPISPGEGGAPAASVTPEGWLRSLPHHLDGGIDGFFAARFRRAD